MRCYSCAKWSFSIFCKTCRNTLLVPTMRTRTVGTLDVISFFDYKEIELFLLTKHKAHGHRIYQALAQMTFAPFIKELNEAREEEIYIIGIDEHVKSGYSHVAILSHAMKTRYTKVLHASLMAQNTVKYAGKDLEFRMNNPRDFMYKGKKNISVILIDDIITTGITLQEAQNVLMKKGVTVLFALTLAKVSVKNHSSSV